MHDGAVAVVSEDGAVVASTGDIDQPFFLRSAAKPFQSFVSQTEGASLSPLQLAIAAASHDGEPAHVALVESMLRQVGLDVADLGCPPGWPLSATAAERLREQGHKLPSPLWHSCSGKHAGWLRACQARGWAVDGYLDADHPIQQRCIDLVSELGGFQTWPVGVDGCGAPVLRTTARVMARLFARLATLPELAPTFNAMHRYPALVSGTGNGDAELAIALDAAAKRGAAGCLGVAIRGRLGIAVKSWDGSQEIAQVAMIATLDAIGELHSHAGARLEPLAHPVVMGGGESVGEVESRVELRWA